MGTFKGIMSGVYEREFDQQRCSDRAIHCKSCSLQLRCEKKRGASCAILDGDHNEDTFYGFRHLSDLAIDCSSDEEYLADCAQMGL